MAKPSSLFKIRDAMHQMALGFKENSDMVKDGYEFRYEQTDDEYRLQGFYGAPDAKRSTHGALDDRPAWLINIVDVALVAGAVSRATNPPPDFILWFRTDKDYNLKEYVEL
jgi:hypothetical protein